ncbi:hypothetical protein BN1058_02351 [Paraliobacillus sp. PM-2]|uniref:PilN domain-containing protein n=1 Tax=Paraliobacillus sp. PM-2 TaxID=1462524 RepID=UPI00061C7846|nr:hypothetical protein [Paraliobacillus sp. PM-2]CQR48012.1 hypothetical protein BN1058_02351 [Paraliobacillus sp. PM-2]
MIEINLVEKKKVNASPYLLVGTFLIGIAIITVSLFVYQENLNEKQQLLMNSKQENSLILNEIREKNIIIQQKETLTNQISQLQHKIYPSTYLLNQVYQVLPDEARIEEYYFTIEDGLKVNIKTNSINDTSLFVRAMSKLTFIEKSNLLSLNKTSDTYMAEFTFQVSKDFLLEEAD